ncbi:MAG: glycosyltransferase family 4 protein [Crocinitomicaceae bacterium]
MNKILILTQTTNINSGWGRYSFEIIKNLSKKTEVIVLEEGKGESRLFKKDSFGSFVKNIFLARKMARKVEIVHVLDGWPYAVYGYVAVWGTSKKLFINAIGTYSIPPKNLFSIKGLLMKLAYLKASKVFSISRYTDGILKSIIPWVDSVVVHLGVSQLPEPSIEVANSVMSKISDKYPIILTVGALKRRKGQLHTLKAVHELTKDYPNILYVIVGDDSDIEYKNDFLSFVKENNLENNILITGSVSDSELSAWYKNSDIFVLNSINHDGHFEGFGLVYLEAGMTGLPVVGSLENGAEDAIRNRETGILVPQGDLKYLTGAILEIIRNEDLAKQMSYNGIQWAKNHNWDVIVSRYIEIYEQVN